MKAQRGPAQALPGVPDGRRERQGRALEARQRHLHARPHHHEVPDVLREPAGAEPRKVLQSKLITHQQHIADTTRRNAKDMQILINYVDFGAIR